MQDHRALGTDRWIRWGAWLFPIVVWALATMLLHGDLGRWNDDYAFNQRIPETGEAPHYHPSMNGVFSMKQQFWRPLFFVIIPALQTACWDSPWINHALHALLHLGLCALIWRFLLRLQVSRWTAASLTLLYMTFPVHFQTLFWSACLTTVVATAIYVVLTLMYLKYAAIPAGRGGSGWAILGWTIGMTAVGTLIPLINEQPAAAVIALPFLHPAFRLRRDWSRGARTPDIARALLPIGTLLVMYAAYLFMYVKSSPPGYPATQGTFIDLHVKAMLARVAPFLDLMWKCLTIENHWDELFKDGVRAIKSLGIEGIAWTAATILTGSAWGWRWFSDARPIVDQHERDSVDAGLDERSGGNPARIAEGDSASRRAYTFGQVFCFGLTAFASAWGVIFMLKVYEPAPRLYFMPLIGVLAILGFLVDGVIARLLNAGTWGCMALRVAGVFVVPVVIGGAVILAGAQKTYRDVFYRDEGYGAQLRALVPENQRDKFIALVRAEDPKFKSGEVWFDRQFHQIFLSSYNMSAWIKQQMRRSTATGASYNHLRGEYKVVDEHSLGWCWWFVPEGTPSISGDPWGVRGVWQVPWENVVPFKIDADGNLRLVTEVAIQRGDNSDGHVRPAAVAEIAKSRPVPEEVATFYNPSADRRMISLGPWKWQSSGIVPFGRPFDWDMVYTVTPLQTESAKNQGRSRMFTVLPPNARAARVCFRAGLSRRDVAKGVPGVEIRWTINGSETPVGSLTVTPGVMNTAQRWIPVTFEVPPHAQPIPMEVAVRLSGPGEPQGGPDSSPSSAAEIESVQAWVSEGMWEPLAAPR